MTNFANVSNIFRKTLNMKHILTLTLTALICVMGFAQNGDYLDVNNVRAYINPDGTLFNKDDKAAFEVPKKTPYDSLRAKHSIFSHQTWISGLDSVTNYLHASASSDIWFTQPDSNDFNFGPIASNYTNSTYRNRYNRVWKVSQTEIADHIAKVGSIGYTIPDAILHWPAHGATTNGECLNLANFVDVNFDNIYTPSLGDYPSIRGDECLLLIFNDEGHKQTHSGRDAMKLEIHALVYAYNTGSNPIDNTIFVNYRVINRSWNTYKNVRFGAYTDMDLGCFSNDYIGCDSTNNFFYAYNGEPDDGLACGGYGTRLPIQSCIFLNQSMDNYVYYNNDFSLIGNPENDTHFDNYLNSKWKDGVPITYGGNGRGGASPTNYMYPSDPSDPLGWSECEQNNTPADRRGLGSTNINRLEPQASFCVDLAFMFDSAYAFCSSISGYVTMVNQVQTFYASQNNSCATPVCGNLLSVNNAESMPLNFQCFPNPTSEGVLYINLNNEVSLGKLSIFDISGKMILQQDIPKLSGENYKIDVSSLSAGTYLIQVSNDGRLGSQKVVVH